MKFPSFDRSHLRKILNRRGRKGRLAGRVRLDLETLEDRTVMSVLPAPTITAYSSLTSSTPSAPRDNNTPSIAYDPVNPNHLVSVYTNNFPGVNGTQKVFINGQYSLNAGQT